MPSSKVLIPLRVTPEFQAYLRQKADEDQLSVNSLVVQALTRYLRYRSGDMSVSIARSSMPAKKIGANDLCPCGSGKKYKKCCALK
jgi:uncharacterized protein YecA (UPF0149 family)